MLLRLLTLTLAATALVGAVAACGGDDDDANDPEPGETDVTDANGGDGNGAGSAILTIGDETWEFDDLVCVFSAEEAGNPNVAFRLNATTASDAGPLNLAAAIEDLSGEGQREGDEVIKSVSLTGPSGSGVNWSTIGQLLTDVPLSFEINGQEVRVEGVFDDHLTDDLVEVEGTLEATCP